MKSAEVFTPEAKKSDQSVGRGVNTSLSPSRRMNTSRTESANLNPGGNTTVWEPLLQPTRAISKGLVVCFFGMSSSSKKTAYANNCPLRQILIGHCLKHRYLRRR